jgi:pyruvate formate-lyase/glycerol dehydratase family glycyl radical enzyme
MTEAIRRLRDKVFDKASCHGWFTLERIKMHSYLETEGLPYVLRRARMLESLLEEIPISIDEDDIIAGCQDDCFSPSYNLFRGGIREFEGYCGYLDAYHELDGIPEEEVKRVRDYWINEEFECKLLRAFTSEERLAMKEAVCFVEPVTGHTIAHYGKVLAIGLDGIREEAAVGLREAAKNGEKDRLLFYEAVGIACNAVKRLASRYAVLARDVARCQTDLEKKRRLLRIADSCSRVPGGPSKSFFDAIQSFWLTWMAMTLEQTPNPYAFSIGRFDQFMWPFYKTDRDRGLITRDEALELIEALWIKFCVGNKFWAVSQNVIIGGQDRDGRDASNELTWLCIEASENLKLPQPSISFRYHEGCPEELFRRVIEFVRKGMGMPAIHNDEEIIKSKVEMGVTAEDARDYAIAGCQEPVVQGCENARTTATWLNLAKCLELALNDGISLLSGVRLGPSTGRFEDFTSYESVVTAFWRQVEYFLDMVVEMHNRTDKLLAEMRPVPFLSSIMNDCIKKGKDFRSGGARYDFSGCLIHGLANVADSLAAVKRLVFEQASISKEELMVGLRSDFRDEELRQILLTHAPKYGNDNEYVDQIAVEIFSELSAMVSSKRNALEGAFRPGFSTPSTHVIYGLCVGPLPEGRKSRETLAYGINPMQGRNTKGPTATMKSATKLPHSCATHGLAFSQSLPPSSVLGEDGTDILLALTRTYLDMGGIYVYYNITDSKTLREAQKYPEKHQDLIVRVHGMSARFVTLDQLIQEDIITRIESGL